MCYNYNVKYEITVMLCQGPSFISTRHQQQQQAWHHLGKCIHLSGVKAEFAAPEEELSEGREL